LTAKFTIKKGPSQLEATVFSADGKEEIARIRKGEGPEFRMQSTKDDIEWILSNNIDGEHRRFSFSVREIKKKDYGAGGQVEGHTLLTIRDNIFKHNGRFYMLANHPEGKLWQDYINNPIRYISRLDSFPHSDESEIEKNKQHQHLRQKVKRFRGVPVGEASGLGATPGGHSVTVNNELDDIGLFIAAASYLMYASA
jgi:hypothetical protein